MANVCHTRLPYRVMCRIGNEINTFTPLLNLKGVILFLRMFDFV